MIGYDRRNIADIENEKTGYAREWGFVIVILILGIILILM